MQKIISNFFKNKTSLLPRFTSHIKPFCILRNKDQKGEHDKSYSGTDSKHQGGSNRVLDDDKKPIITTVITDSPLHHHTNTSGTDFSKEDTEKKGKTSENFGVNEPNTCNRTQSNEQDQNYLKENINRQDKKKKETPTDKQEKY